MKNTLLTFALIIAGHSLYAQTNIYESGENVGIGTTSPVTKLDVEGGNINVGNTTDLARAISVTSSTSGSASLVIGNTLMNTEFKTNFSGSTDAYGIPTNAIGLGNAFNYP